VLLSNQPDEVVAATALRGFGEIELALLTQDEATKSGTTLGTNDG
jgi:hypothetical protein